MKKGIKVGARVTGRKLWLTHRVYGRVIAYLGRNQWAVVGKFGRCEFHGSQLKPISAPRAPMTKGR